MASLAQLAYPPLLCLDIPRSPLLSDTFSKDLLSKLEAAGISTPLPNLSFASSHNPNKSNRALATPVLAAISGYTPKRAAERSENKSSTAIPRCAFIPPKEIISLLELLDEMDDDVAKEVQRVRDSIKETHELIRQLAQAEKVRVDRLKKRHDKQRRETKAIDDDFWLNAWCVVTTICSFLQYEHGDFRHCTQHYVLPLNLIVCITTPLHSK
ncbi:hypothetical protein K474DRAFT_1768110 [Panus rudis PR-1116 ss-1]|nr:hypothetical protein K474DRAFT_1768110 [Panus rudis PR-1116 ss-1]